MMRPARPQRSGTVLGLTQERFERPRDDLALGQAAAGGMGTQMARHVFGKLHGNRDGRLDDRHRNVERPSLPDITVGLTARDHKVAGQSHGGLRHAEAATEQPKRGVQTVSLLRVGRSRHETWPYYRLRRRSRTDAQRSSGTARSKAKLPFAFRE